ncbi:hypothetical protein T484DRAFT_1874368, partial [Baffinella frigidus]
MSNAPKHPEPLPNTVLSQRSTWALADTSKLGCKHLDEWIGSSGAWADSYTTVLKFVNGLKLQRSSGKTAVKYPVCFTCGEGPPAARLFVSLQGVHVGCKKGKAGGCMGKHAAESNHPIAVDLARGEVFCFSCQDVVYDGRLEKVRHALLDGVRTKPGDGAPGNGHAAKTAGVEAAMLCVPRRRDWIPNEACVKRLKESAEPVEGDDAAVAAGLRGLHNVGNTCFLNCVLQGLVHNPGIRDYFLGDFHNRHRCQKKREVEGRADVVCMGCEADLLFNEMFQGGQRNPFTPHQFLYGMWKSSHHLAGYEQQDAHECFISLLDALQAACEGDPCKKEHSLMKSLFQGRLRSDVTCLACKVSSTTREAFSDLPLDLRSTHPTSSPTSTPSRNTGGGKGTLASGMWDNVNPNSSPGAAGGTWAGGASGGG